MPGRSKRPWARRKRCRQRRRAHLLHAFHTTANTAWRTRCEQMHMRQREWEAEQLRDEAAATLLRIKFIDIGIPPAEATGWLHGVALDYARFVPFRALGSEIDIANTFAIELPHTQVRNRAQVIVCGDDKHPSLRIKRERIFSDAVYRTTVYGVPKIDDAALVLARMSNGSRLLGTLTCKNRASICADSNNIVFTSSPGQHASIEYRDIANTLHSVSLRHVASLRELRRTSCVVCRDGYQISLFVGSFSDTWPRPTVCGPFRHVDAGHYPRANPNGLWSNADLLVVESLRAGKLRALVRSHGGVLFGRLPRMLR